MFMVNQLTGFDTGGEGPATIVWTANAFNGNNDDAYSFSNINLGVPASNRQIVVGVVVHDATRPEDVTAMTIDGIAAGRVAWAVNSEIGLDFWTAEVPNNATGDIVVTLASTANRCGIGVWAVYGARTAPFQAARNTDDPMAAVLDIPVGSVGIGLAGHNGGGTFGWTNMAKRYDETVESATVHSGADATGDGALTRTADPSVSAPASRAMLLASWGAGLGALAHAVDAASTNANSSAYTFSNLQFGYPTSDRQIVVCIAGFDGSDTGDHVTAVTVGQQTGTLLARQASPVDSDNFSEMWVASVPEGESGTVEVTISVGIAGCSIVLYRLIGASTTAHDTATNADDPLTTTIDVPNNGCCIATAQYRSSSLNVDWTGVGKDAEGTEETQYHYSMASKNFTTGEAGRTVTADGTSALDRRALVVVSWGRA